MALTKSLFKDQDSNKGKALTVSTEVLEAPNGERIDLVTVEGRIDAVTYIDFDSCIKSLITDAGCNIAIKMSGVNYINSTGMGLMVSFAGEIVEQNGSVVIIQPSDTVTNGFSLLGLMEFFTVYEDVEDYINTFELREEEQQATENNYNPLNSAYPKHIKCRQCGSIVDIEVEGKYACPTCSTCIAADSDGSVKVYVPQKSEVADFALPLEAQWMFPIINGVEILADKYGYADSVPELLQNAIDDVWGEITSHKSEINDKCEITIIANSESLIIGFALSQRKIVAGDKPEESLLIKALSNFIDEVQIAPLGDDGQVLKLVKKASL